MTEAERARAREYKRASRARNPARDKANRLRDRQRNREQYLARLAVKKAVKHGRIVKPDLCEGCQRPTEKEKLQGHHEKGYSRENRYRVVWLCTDCHNSHH